MGITRAAGSRHPISIQKGLCKMQSKPQRAAALALIVATAIATAGTAWSAQSTAARPVYGYGDPSSNPMAALIQQARPIHLKDGILSFASMQDFQLESIRVASMDHTERQLWQSRFPRFVSMRADFEDMAKSHHRYHDYLESSGFNDEDSRMLDDAFTWGLASRHAKSAHWQESEQGDSSLTLNIANPQDAQLVNANGLVRIGGVLMEFSHAGAAPVADSRENADGEMAQEAVSTSVNEGGKHAPVARAAQRIPISNVFTVWNLTFTETAGNVRIHAPTSHVCQDFLADAQFPDANYRLCSVAVSYEMQKRRKNGRWIADVDTYWARSTWKFIDRGTGFPVASQPEPTVTDARYGPTNGGYSHSKDYWFYPGIIKLGTHMNFFCGRHVMGPQALNAEPAN
jgi:hypothetical protein